MQNRPCLTSLLLCCLLPITSFAATDWSQCTVPVIQPRQDVNYDLFVTEIEADHLSTLDRQYYQLSGDASLIRGDQTIRADQIDYFKDLQQIRAQGNILYADDRYQILAQQVELDDQDRSGSFSGTSFQLYQNHIRGSATEIQQFDADNSLLYDVSYTTCDPGQNTWSINANRLRLNQQTGQGTAYHAVLRVKDIPVFYSPWFMFPITSDRMSGFLPPALSSSDRDGTYLSLPWYWNQAVNYDMTIIPIWYSRRGIQLNTENRYLFDGHQGTLNLSWLDDDLYDDERWFRHWSHQSQLPLDIQTTLLIQRVSDEDFPDDFEHLDAVNDADYLQSKLQMSTTIGGWSTSLLLEEYQTINLDKTPPYRRDPQLSVERLFSFADSGFELDWRNEWVSFDQEDSITGDRLHISTAFSYPLEDTWYFLYPSLQLDYTEYALDNNSNDINDIERSLPLFSVDSGLIFERLASAEHNLIQTLEPRLFLLYVPFEDQQDIPDFDTALLSDSYANLFINNRFSGVDRIGDARQLSFGLTTRVLDQTSSDEIFSASIGQAFYAEDREVSLGNSVDERDKSNLMTLLSYRPYPNWTLQLASVYDQEESESKQTDITIRQRADDQLLNLEYHFRENSLEQSTLSLVYPLAANWTGFAKRQYSILNQKPVQNLVGLSYEGCCWGLQLLYEKASDKDFEEVDRTIYLQLTFKGLTSAGRDIDAILEDGILGYQSRN
ncbi:MAG: LPS assembly protein LptD [Gammaproteobacteria bacterium]|nr:LPS assembly protein LptD [Gammaproteobacteria bacterium]